MVAFYDWLNHSIAVQTDLGYETELKLGQEQVVAMQRRLDKLLDLHSMVSRRYQRQVQTAMDLREANKS